MSPVVAATAQFTQVEGIQRSLAEGVDVDARSPGQATALMMASQLGWPMHEACAQQRMYRWEGKAGTIWKFSACHDKKAFRGRVLPDTGRESTKCGRFWVFAYVSNPGKQSIWRQCPPSARKQNTKKMPIRPVFDHVQETPLSESAKFLT